MGDELLRRSKQLVAEVENQNAEYLKSLDIPSDLEGRLHTFLQTKDDLEGDLDSISLQQMILKELELPSEQMLTGRKIEKENAESEELLSESKAAYEHNLSKIEATKPLVLEALDCLNASLKELSQKITLLEDKYEAIQKECQKSESYSSDSINLSSNKRTKERILLVLENAKQEKDLIENRLSRLESLHKLAENTANCVQSDDKNQLALERLQEKLSGLEFLSGLKCEIIDDRTVAIHFIDQDTERLPGDDRLTITLSFTPDDSQCLELTAVNTNIKIPEVETAAENVEKSRDLPKLIKSLRTAWLSYVTLAAEISSLRESHAIDWKSDSRVFHLMIAKYICRLSVPPSYPCDGGRITLEQILGGPSSLTSVTVENPPKDFSLTGWVTHLENILA